MLLAPAGMAGLLLLNGTSVVSAGENAVATVKRGIRITSRYLVNGLPVVPVPGRPASHFVGAQIIF